MTAIFILNKGHIYRHASKETEWNFSTIETFQQINDALKIIEIILSVYSVYFLSKNMKVNLMHHFIFTEYQNDRI